MPHKEIWEHEEALARRWLWRSIAAAVALGAGATALTGRWETAASFGVSAVAGLLVGAALGRLVAR